MRKRGNVSLRASARCKKAANNGMAQTDQRSRRLSWVYLASGESR
jgi:hypothetical protein